MDALEFRPSRNTVLGIRRIFPFTSSHDNIYIVAEKTPRHDEFLDPHPGPPRPELVSPDRWKLPSRDEGILAKFSSQKNVFQTNNSLEAEMRAAMALQREAKAATLSTSGADDYSRNSAPPLTSIPLNSSTNETFQSLQRKNNETPKKHLGDKKSSWTKQRMSTLRVLGQDEPIVMKEFRASRAAQFVNQTKNPLSPPPPSTTPLNNTIFKPYGSIPFSTFDTARRQKEDEARAKGSVPVEASKHPSTAADLPSSSTLSKEELHLLIEELGKTEEAIEKQKLLLGLRHRTHGYERQRAHGSSSTLLG